MEDPQRGGNERRNKRERGKGRKVSGSRETVCQSTVHNHKQHQQPTTTDMYQQATAERTFLTRT